jgi:hypothetical protein
MSSPSIEERLAALEAEVARLKQLMGAGQPKGGWQQIIGTFRNDPYYEQAMKLGRAYRESLRPKKPKKPRKKHGNA